MGISSGNLISCSEKHKNSVFVSGNLYLFNINFICIFAKIFTRMKYLDFYNTNPKVVKALFGIKLFGSKNEDTMPELDTSNKDSIKA